MPNTGFPVFFEPRTRACGIGSANQEHLPWAVICELSWRMFSGRCAGGSEVKFLGPRGSVVWSSACVQSHRVSRVLPRPALLC